MEETKIKTYVRKELSKLKFSLHSKGGMYLADAILICIKDERAIENLSQNVYAVLAERYNAKTLNTIKSGMQHSIETMYKNTEAGKVKKYFYMVSDHKPTLKQVIETVTFKYETYEQRNLKDKMSA